MFWCYSRITLLHVRSFVNVMYSVHISKKKVMHAIFTYNRSAEHKYDEAPTI